MYIIDMYNIHFLADTSYISTDVQDVIRKSVDRVYGEVSELLSLKDCSVLVKENVNIPNDIVFDSYTGDAEGFYIMINPKTIEGFVQKGEDFIYENIKEHVLAGLYATNRSQHHEKEDSYTLLEEIVEEGLIAHFIEEIQGRKDSFHDKMSVSEIDTLYERMKVECKNKDCNINDWFSGTDDGIPEKAVRIVGYRVVNNYLSKHNLKSTDVITVPPNTFNA